MDANRFKLEILVVAKQLVNLIVLYMTIYPIIFLIILFGKLGLFPLDDLHMKIVGIGIGIIWGIGLIYCDSKKKFRVWK